MIKKLKINHPLIIGTGFAAMVIATIVMVILPSYLGRRSLPETKRTFNPPTKADQQKMQSQPDFPEIPFIPSHVLLGTGNSAGEIKKSDALTRIIDKMRPDIQLPTIDIPPMPSLKVHQEQSPFLQNNLAAENLPTSRTTGAQQNEETELE